MKKNLFMLCLNGDLSSKNYLIGPQNPTAILLQFTFFLTKSEACGNSKKKPQK